MFEELGLHRGTVFILMIISFLVSFLGTREAVNSTMLYNELDLRDGIVFNIVDKYNKKKEGAFFPDLNFKGKIFSKEKLVEIKVSKGDYDSHKVGQDITVFKTNSDVYVSDYEIKNQMIIHLGDNGFSFVIIPTFIFYLVGLFCIYKLFRG